MTEARIEPVPPDPATGRLFLDRAEDYWSDASDADLDPVSRQLLSWQACISAMDAVLQAVGKRVAGSDGGHSLRIEAVENCLPGDHGDLFERLQAHRELRNEASYAIRIVSEKEAESLHRAAGELLEAARVLIEDNL